jgi:trimethylamine:corrinoid methyltransferase-like protein
MLDFLLAFSLPKLVLDDEIAAQALHFVRDIRPLDDLPTSDLVREMLTEGPLMIADQTLAHWPAELYLPGPTYDRDNRERWTALGSSDALTRATAEVERRLAAWEPVETDDRLVAELRALVESGLPEGAQLPA